MKILTLLKKHASAFALLLALFLLFPMAVSCAKALPPESLSQIGLPTAEQIENIRESVIEDGFTSVERYYGIYNHYMVISFSSDLSWGVSETIEIAGFSFNVMMENKLFAYKDGDLVPLEKAFENGDLAKKDIEQVWLIHSNWSMYRDEWETYYNRFES